MTTPHEILAGWAKQEVTPPEPVLMAGYGFRTHRSLGVYMPLRVGVVCLRSPGGDGEVCLVTLDVANVQVEDATIFRAALERELAMSPEAVVLLPSHTHSGPLLHENWANFAVNQIGDPERRLRETFTQAIVQCAREARDNAAPAKIEIAYGESDVGINRRGPDGTSAPNPQGVTDPTVTTLVITKHDQPDAPCLLFAYGCHPTTRGGYLIGPDYPGFARVHLEEKYPGLTSFFVQGFEGDVRPANFDKDGHWLTQDSFLDKVAHFGEKLAIQVGRIYQQENRTTLTGPIRAGQITIELPLELTQIDHRLRQAQRSDKPAHNRWAQRMRQRLDENDQLETAVPVVVHGLTIGQAFGFLGFGGEVCCAYAHGFRQRLPGKHLLLSALTDDNAASYLPTEQILREGGYEANMYLLSGRPGPYRPDLEPTLYHAGTQLLEELWALTATHGSPK